MTLTKRQLRLWIMLRKLISLGVGAYALTLLIFMVLRLLFGDSLWWLAFFGNFTPFYFATLIVLLPLALLIRSKRGALLLLPFALVGIVWFGPLYLPKAQAQPDDDAPTLRVVTFNVWGDNTDLTHVETWLRDSNADLVLTQEIPPAWAGGSVPLLDTTYPHKSVQPADLRYWGNGTWSRYPIVSAENFDLEDDGTPTQSRSVIEVQGQQVAVYNIHLYTPMSDTPQIALPMDNPYLNMVLKYDHTARNGQIRRLIERLEGEPLPYIVAGDFNMSDQTDVYQDLAALMNDSFREAGAGLGTSWPAVQAIGLPGLLPPLVRIDYIWHSDNFQALQAEQGPYLGSDHLPLSAALSLS
jgi:endonuclease/exonuclease/phosphatase (EEP) superfamily protein YafD